MLCGLTIAAEGPISVLGPTTQHQKLMAIFNMQVFTYQKRIPEIDADIAVVFFRRPISVHYLYAYFPFARLRDTEYIKMPVDRSYVTRAMYVRMSVRCFMMCLPRCGPR